METGFAMTKKKDKNLFDISDTVSDETSSAYALLTGLISNLRNSVRMYQINGKKYTVRVDSEGKVDVEDSD